MKKLLLVTSAIVAAGAFTSEAFAQAKPVTLSVGGYWGSFFVYNFNQKDDVPVPTATVPRSGGNDRRGRAFASTGEIQFKGSTTLDNGLQVGAQIELEADVDADQIDEAWIDFRGSFGRVILGKFDPVVRELTRSAPNAIRGGNTELVSINEQGFITHPQTAVGAAGGLGANVGNNAGANFSTLGGFSTSDGDKIYWMSPTFSGFNLSVSYMPRAIEYNTTGGAPSLFAQTQGAGLADFIDVGLEYNGKLGDVGVSAAIAVQTAKPEGSLVFGGTAAATAVVADGQQFAGTASGILTFGDFKVGGALRYAPYNIKSTNVAGAALAAGSRDKLDIIVWEAGASYDLGAWRFAATVTGGSDETLSNSLLGGEVEKRAYMLSTSYLLGPGVAAIGGLIYEKFDYKSGTAAVSVDNKGTTAIVGLGVGF